MARLLRILLKLAVIGAILAVVVKVLQNRSHPSPVVDRNAYNSWEPLTDTNPVAPAADKAKEADPATNGAAKAQGAAFEKAGDEPAATAAKAPTKQAASTTSPAKKAPTKKAPAKRATTTTSTTKKAPTKKAPAKKATTTTSTTKKAPAKKAPAKKATPPADA